MKNLKKNMLFLGMMVASLALTGCGNDASKPSKSKSAGGDESSEPAVDDRPEYNVKIVGADGAELSNSKVKAGDAIEKPADPTAPAGQKFYGWMNVKNGGQIWNFEDETLKVVMEDVELKPLFVPANQNSQNFEAELCPDITERTGKERSSEGIRTFQALRCRVSSAKALRADALVHRTAKPQQAPVAGVPLFPFLQA